MKLFYVSESDSAITTKESLFNFDGDNSPVTQGLFNEIRVLVSYGVALPKLAGCTFVSSEEFFTFKPKTGESSADVDDSAVQSGKTLALKDKLKSHIGLTNAEVNLDALVGGLLELNKVHKAYVADVLALVLPDMHTPVSTEKKQNKVSSSVSVPALYRDKVLGLIHMAIESGKFPVVPVAEPSSDEMSIIPDTHGSSHKYKQMVNEVYRSVTGEEKLSPKTREKFRNEPELKAEYFARIKSKLMHS